MDFVSIAQIVSAIGSVTLAILFGVQQRVFSRQVTVNSDTLQEMRESRITQERPQIIVTVEYRHGTLVEVVIRNIGRGGAKDITFDFSAPLESSMSI